jgi:hypothetical protein
MCGVPMLECPGVFTMPFVPEGWTSTSEGNLFELQPPSGDAAVHISVYSRSPTQLEPGQAERHLRKFVERRPIHGNLVLRSLAQKDEEQRAFARYQNWTEDGVLREWFAGCILWPTAMLMCTCNARPGNPALKEGEVMIASIFQGTEEGQI